MEQGRVYRIDLPGGERNIVRLAMVCRPLGAPGVAVEILARK
jgi:hypothetical protein